MGLFRKSRSEALGVTMAGVKLGQRLLAVGTKDPKLVAALGVKAGLTGRTCVVDADAAHLANFYGRHPVTRRLGRDYGRLALAPAAIFSRTCSGLAQLD